MQTVTGRGGNCMSACLASILELPIAAVPNFFDLAPDEPGPWWKAVRDWLRPHGFGIITLAFEDAKLWDELSLDGFHIVSGPSPRLEGAHHSTVWHSGRMVHDPHPDQTGIPSPLTLELLYPLNPAWQRHGRGTPHAPTDAQLANTFAQFVTVGPVAQKPPCTVCGKPWEQHGSYPTCATHPYTPGSNCQTVAGATCLGAECAAGCFRTRGNHV